MSRCVKFVLIKLDQVDSSKRGLTHFITVPFFHSYSVQELIMLVESGGPGSEMARQFLTMLAVCHTVIPDRDETQPESGIKYHAASPGKLPHELDVLIVVEIVNNNRSSSNGRCTHIK